MQEREVKLYTILQDGTINRYPKVDVPREESMPSGGSLSNPTADKALVKNLEDKMIISYGTAMVELKCKAAHHRKEVNLRWKRALGPQHALTFAALGGKMVDLEHKMLRPVHVDALFAAVNRYQVTGVNLEANQLGAEGGSRVAAGL